jgi:DNA-binding beta-propeller fold protein YncE
VRSPRVRVLLLALLAAAATTAGIVAAAAGSDDVQLMGIGAPVQKGKAGVDSNTSFNATLPNGRRITPAGVSTQVGEEPLGATLTPDGSYLVATADDERNGGKPATGIGNSDEAANGSDSVVGGYYLNVVRTSDMQVVASAAAPANPVVNQGVRYPKTTYRLQPATPVASPTRSQSDAGSTYWLGVAVKSNVIGPGWTVYASGGPNDVIDVFNLDPSGALALVKVIPVEVPDPNPTAATVKPNSGLAAPGGLWLSADGGRLYFVDNNAFTVSAIDTSTNTEVGTPVPVGFFPYTAIGSPDGRTLYVSNWGVADRSMGSVYRSSYDAATHTGDGSPFIGGGSSNVFAVPATDPARTSSITILRVGPTSLSPLGSIPLGLPIDGIDVAGGTHPSALAVASGRGRSALYVADASEDTIAVIDVKSARLVRKIGLPEILDGPADRADANDASDRALGLTPNALAVAGERLYVAEAGLNAVAVFDLHDPLNPKFAGRIPTGWYPTGVTTSPDGRFLYVINEKGYGNPHGFQGQIPGSVDDNLTFGTAQKIELSSLNLKASTQQVADNTYRKLLATDATKRFATAARQIKHVIFVLRENKSYDAYLGDDATLNGRGADGEPSYASTYGPYVPNTKKLAETFAVGDNAYADSEESNAGHFFALAGQSTDYQQKTLLSRFTRPYVNTKNEDPEDLPLRGFLFNNFARARLSYRDYGDLIRVSGYDEYAHPNACSDDPYPGCDPATESTDTTAPTVGLGGNYTEDIPGAAVLRGHIDATYPGWNIRITDQRRAKEFIRDFGALVKAGKAPAFTFVWLPNDHTGSAPPKTPQQEVSDNDLALGQIVDFISHSAIWPSTAIFVSEDDTQGSADHVNAHRSYTLVVSPWAKRGAVVHRLSSTVSIPKTIEEIFRLQPMSLGDQVANDLSDYFTDRPDFTPYTAATPVAAPSAGPLSLRILAAAAPLTAGAYDENVTQLSEVESLFEQSMRLARSHPGLSAAAYRARQDRLYREAVRIVGAT